MMPDESQFQPENNAPSVTPPDADDAWASVAPTPIRVAWLAGPETFNRIGRLLQPLAVGLMDELVNVTIFLPERADEREIPTLPIDVIRFSRTGWRLFRARTVTQLATEIATRQIDLLHALDASASDQAKRLSHATGLEYVVSSYSLLDAEKLGELDNHAAAVLPATEAIRQALLQTHVVPPDRVHLIRPGVYQVSKPTCFRDTTKSVAVIAGGQMDDFAAYDTLLQTFNEIKIRNFDCQFFIIANGKAETRIRAAAEQMGLNPKLTFIDRQPALQLQGILKSADIYISPVTLPQVDVAALLAMAAGDPVLAPADSTDDFVEDGKTAVKFQPGDSRDLTQKLIGVLEDRDRTSAMTQSALDYLREHHSPAGMVRRMTAIYRQTVESREHATAPSRRSS
ncbi:MAG: glycosyltransferase family 4 protein [Phycisphaerae bacterium]|nr:glycosyltransferase family 4 protein [Phycisphaerae bacterium]